MDQETLAVLNRIHVGEAAESFLESVCGKYLVAVAQAESERAKMDLMFVDPTDTAKIFKLQKEAQVAEAALKWLGEAILVGQQSQFELQQQTAGDD
jgi:hypothetical protein